MINSIKSTLNTISNKITYSFSGMLNGKRVTQLKSNCCSLLEKHKGSKTALLIAILLFSSLGTAVAVKMMTGSAIKAGIPLAIGLATSYGIYKNEEEKKRVSLLANSDYTNVEIYE